MTAPPAEGSAAREMDPQPVRDSQSETLQSILGSPSTLKPAASTNTQNSAGKLFAMTWVRSFKGQQLFMQRV